MATVALIGIAAAAELSFQLKTLDYTVLIFDNLLTTKAAEVLNSQPEAVIIAAAECEDTCWSLCQQFRSLVVLVALEPEAFLRSDMRVAAYRAGAAHVLLLPLAVPEVLLLLRRGLRRLRQTQELRRQNQLLARKTLQDPLTGCGNREALEVDWLDYRDRGMPLAVFMLDLDHFKDVNDTYGHLVGDVVLKVVAARIEQQLRPMDALYRYGGEEFVVIAPLRPQTDFEMAVHLIGNRVRLHISSEPIWVYQEETSLNLTITISIGGTVVQSRSTLAQALAIADKALYDAKAQGRDRVCWLAGHP